MNLKFIYSIYLAFKSEWHQFFIRFFPRDYNLNLNYWFYAQLNLFYQSFYWKFLGLKTKKFKIIALIVNLNRKKSLNFNIGKNWFRMVKKFQRQIIIIFGFEWRVINNLKTNIYEKKNVFSPIIKFFVQK